MSGKLVLRKNNALLKTIWALALICSVILLLLNHVIRIDNAKIYIMLIKIAITAIIMMMAIAVFMGVALYRLRKPAHGNKLVRVFYKTLHFVFPFLYALGKMLKFPKSDIRRSYVSVNNQLVHILYGKYQASEALILTPHCLQNNECNIKVTGDSNYCKRCGKCDVQTLVELSEKYDIPLIIATGGTLARKAIEDIKPKIIFAVACERDLAAGVYDIQTVPVIGVLNKLPNGPCFNTFVDVEAIENEIIRFIE